MVLYAEFQCPYCGHEDSISTGNEHGWIIKQCEIGDCNKRYVVSYKATISVTSYVIGTDEERGKMKGGRQHDNGRFARNRQRHNNRKRSQKINK